MTPGQVDACENRNAERRERFAEGAIRSSEIHATFDDVDRLIHDLRNEREARQMQRHLIRDLEDALSTSRTKLATARQLLKDVEGLTASEKRALQYINED